MYIKRNIEDDILNLSKSFPVIMITGPRQVGKTTLLNYLSEKMKKNATFVSLDDIETRTLALEDPKLFLEIYKPPLIIDEFQYAPNILNYIKIIVDKKRLEELNGSGNSNGLYFLTGSQSFISMKNVSESLAGRVGITSLYSLSLREINGVSKELFNPEINQLKSLKVEKNKTELKDLYQIIFKGGYPELYKNVELLPNKFYESYVKTYIERDIRDIINIKDEVKFMKFMISVAARTAQELNITEIANDVEVSNTTINDWISILVNTGLIMLLEPYSENIIKRVVKRPKIYFLDTGLAVYLTKYPNAEILESSAYSGHIFETFVISEIVKSFVNNGIDPKRYLYYYRDNNQLEIDLIIDMNNKLYPIEIKKSKSPSKNSVKNFKVLEHSKKEVGTGIVLCLCDNVFPLDSNNYLVPIWYI